MVFLVFVGKFSLSFLDITLSKWNILAWESFPCDISRPGETKSKVSML